MPKHAHAAPPAILADDDLDSPAIGWAELQALREDYDLEAASHLRLLSQSLQTRLAALDRHCHDLVASLDARVRDLSLDRFLGDFDADPERALRVVVEEGMKPVEMGDGEKGARKRKRANPLSPRNGDDDPDLFSAGPLASSKKQRSNPVLASAAKSKAGKAVPGSARGPRMAQGGLGSPTSTRKPSSRLRVRPSQQPTSTVGGSANFIYRASLAASTNGVLPTPSFQRTASSARGGGRATTQTVRKPKRGESIVFHSLNGSPLGEGVASDLDEDAEEEGEQGEEEDWDLMERNEASRSEGTFRAQRSPSKSKLVKRPPPSSSSSSLAHPVPQLAADAFSVPLPPSAPSFAALKAQLAEQIRREMLEALREEAEEGEVGEEERRRWEERVERGLRGV
ncbi:hypothetical protein JCM8097_004241 [Rhodosporidiobolus ruineniae]